MNSAAFSLGVDLSRWYALAVWGGIDLVMNRGGMVVLFKRLSAQVDAVLTDFNATTTAVRGIEEKMERCIEYMSEAQTQQEQLAGDWARNHPKGTS
eukprot:4181258-Amphidinium_carterae.2